MHIRDTIPSLTPTIQRHDVDERTALAQGREISRVDRGPAMGKRGYSAAQIQGVLQKAAEATRVARARPAARVEVAPGAVGGAASGAVGATAPAAGAPGPTAPAAAVSGNGAHAPFAVVEVAPGAVGAGSLAPAAAVSEAGRGAVDEAVLCARSCSWRCWRRRAHVISDVEFVGG